VAAFPRLGHSDGVFALAYSQDGRYLVSGSGDREIKIRDTQSGREPRTLSGHTGPVKSVAFSPGGELRPRSSSGLAPALSRLEAVTPDKEYRFTLPVRLDPGLNLIEVVADDDFNYGLKTVYVNAPQRPEQKGDLWLLAIGINDYANNGGYTVFTGGAKFAPGRR
jgi:hypothetical protein